MNASYRDESEAGRCARCGRPADAAAVLSAHVTSQGWVRYRRCACGATAIELLAARDRVRVHA